MVRVQDEQLRHQIDRGEGTPVELGEAVDDQAGVDLEQPHGIGDELLLWEEAVALVRGLRQGVLENGLDLVRAVVRDADD
ncbi:hypothetical protein ACWEC4_36525 [Streptomyces sp. NPDC005055]